MEKQISITKIKIRHSQILLFLNCPKKPETLQGELRFQNAWLNFCHPVAFYPVGKSLVCPINTDKLENYDGDWKLTIQDSNDTYTPVFTSRVRLSLLLGRHFVRNEETLLSYGRRFSQLSSALPPLAETGSSDFQNQRADSLWYCKTIWSFSEGKTHVACV